MSGFDLSKMMPLYLDETEELVSALTDALLLLEQDPNDSKSLQAAFRYAHTIKGSAALMGFEPVKDLTHQLETIFDQLRSKKRAFDPEILNLFFLCLDGLRDYHQELRASGASQMDLSGLTAQVVAHLTGQPPPAEKSSSPSVEAPLPSEVAPTDEPATIALVVEFVPNLPWADMKAKLILSRLAGKARILATDPPAETLEDADELKGFTVWLASDADRDELRALADVDGVGAIRITDEGVRATESEIADQPPEQAVREQRAEAPIAPGPPAEVPAATAPAEQGEASRTRVAETVRVDLDRLDSLMNLAGELVINKARFIQITGGLQEVFRGSGAALSTSETQDRLESLTHAFDSLAEADSLNNGAVERWRSQVRDLCDNVRAMQDEFDRIRQGRERLGVLTEAIDQLTRVTDGIQKGVLNTRMVPIGPLFGRFRRVVRDISQVSGKEVNLQISGEKTELDKRMIDELGDPLVHMVRNSVDHGLEPPDERERAGKSRAGTVSLGAAHRGNSVVITVSDDGRGIDPERVRKKAVANHLISEAESLRLPERDLIAFIWHPGFSTADRVTDLSGRGVGMDIVKSRIEALNGSVDVRTQLGQGATFSIRLPLTLAIMPSLLVRIYDEVYAIPLDHVDEIVETTPAKVHRVQGRRTLELRRKIVALVELNDVFRWDGGDHPSLANSPARIGGEPIERQRATVVIVQNGETVIGLIVDELIGIQEVVLKSLERNFRAVVGLSGASILGDGRVSLILDIDAVINTSTQPRSRETTLAEIP